MNAPSSVLRDPRLHLILIAAGVALGWAGMTGASFGGSEPSYYENAVIVTPDRVASVGQAPADLASRIE